MESKWSQFFLSKDGSKRLNPIAIVFILIQLLLLIAAIATIVIITDNPADDDAAHYEKIPELTIEGLPDKAPSLTESEIVDIQKKLFETVSANANSINMREIKATIRNGIVHEYTFDNSNYLNLIVDIPSLEQTYELFYSSNAVLDPEVSTFVLCPDEFIESNYQDFNCKNGDDASIRDLIVSSYLSHFKFEYFSAYIDSDNPKTIIISPSVTHDNSTTTKNQYIAEVKGAIDSLGLKSSSYQYYVRTTEDINYDN